MLTVVALAVLAVQAVWAQEPAKYKFEKIDLQAGDGEFDLSGRIHSLTGGADVVLRSTDPAQPSLRVRAKDMDFSYADGATSPSEITLTGNVVIDHPKGTVTAGKAVWSLANDTMVFTDNPVFKRSDPEMEIRGERIELNMASGTAKVKRPVMKDVQFQQAPEATPVTPGLLTVDAITDWSAFLTQLKEQSAADAPSPGKRVVSLLDANTQRYVQTSTVDQLLTNKEAVLKQLNRVLTRRDFYDAASWASVSVPAKTADQLKSGIDALSEDDLVKLNRQLLDAAFPDTVAPMS